MTNKRKARVQTLHKNYRSWFVAFTARVNFPMLTRPFCLILVSSMASIRLVRSFARLSRGAAIFRPLLSTSILQKHLVSTESRRSVHEAVARDSLAETSKTGEFQRRESAWRNWISREDGAEFPPEIGRYHLFVAYACPWAHRTLMTLALKGLKDVVSVTVVHPIWQKSRPEEDTHRGWIFGDQDSKDTLTNADGRGGPFLLAYPGNDAEPLFGYKAVRDLYDHAGDEEGKYTVPILWDKKTSTIVSNESAEIIRMLNSEFNGFANDADLDLYPEDLKDSIEAVNEWVYPHINNGVYRCGFAKSQEAYDKAIDELTEAFDRADAILKEQRYIAGDRLTEADIRLFVTLLRFDEVYTVYFKTNTRSVATTPSMLDYCREIFQMPGIKDTFDMEQIKLHYYASHPELNFYSVVPRGADFMKLLEEPHARDTI